MPASNSEQITVNGLSFRCRVDGPAGAPWIMFSNSLLTDLSLWEQQVAALAGSYRILRYDQRGHGGTEIPPGATTLDELVADARALIDAFRIAEVTMVGVSMGAATALCLAARAGAAQAGARVRRVVASDGQSATAANGAAAWQERIDFAREHGMAAFAEATVQRWMMPESLSAAAPAVARTRAMISGTDRAGFTACARALQAYDFRTELPAIRVPALLIAGEKDGAMPRTMQAMRAEMPDARYVEIPGAGHLPNLEQPVAFNAALLAFLAETESV